MPILKDVPQESVGEIVQSFIDNDNAENVKAEQQPDGTWTVTADD